VTTTRPVRRTLTRLALSLTVVTLLGGALVVGDALQAPGDDQPTAKLAEWGRDHGLNPVVTWLEAAQYEQAPPEVGGLPPGGVPAAAGAVTPTTGAPSASTPASRFPHPAPVPALPPLAAGPALPGEGQWQTVVAFHGGFRLSDPSHNGYFSEGRTVRPLVDGKASLVLHTDGTADVGTWGTEVRMAPDVASVRQNLLPLVDGGQVNPTCATGGQAEWGSTVGQAAYIHRSGFGVTATGAEVYVGGPALSVCTLGRILQNAGVVRGMELDINPTWVSGTYFHDQPGGAPQGFRLFDAERVAPGHYLIPTSRDWYAWYLRP